MRAYNPPPFLLEFGDPVPPEKMPSALLRFPGACGIRDFLGGSLRLIAREGDLIAYFTKKNFDYIEQGVGLFGCLIVFDPVRFHPVQAPDDHVCIGINGPVRIDSDVTWIPPRLMQESIAWDTLRSVGDITELAGSTVHEERMEMIGVLNGYFEEVSAVVASEVPLPPVPWFQVSAEERQEILSALGAQLRFSLPH